MDELSKKKIIFFIIASGLALFALISVFDKALAIGLLFLSFLLLSTLLILIRIGIKDKRLYLLLLIGFFAHLAVVLFVYYANFSPFGGGSDADMYHQTAVEISQRFRQGNFSLAGLYSNHYFPALIGIIYIFTIPEMLVGQLFTVWLAVISLALIYFLIIEIGGSKKSALLIGAIIVFYPSYLFFCSLLLKDTVVVPLVFSGLLLSVKMLKSFSVSKFLAFFVILTGLIHLRFYVGFALMFAFLISWFLISSFKPERRIIYGGIMIILLGFSPQILGYGYYGYYGARSGATPLRNYLNKETIITYREVVYAPSPVADLSSCEECSAGKEVSAPEGPADVVAEEVCLGCDNSGKGSSFLISAGFDNPVTFLRNYIYSFASSLFGPFPWQIQQKRQMSVLVEAIPWYFLFLMMVYGMYKSFKIGGFSSLIRDYKYSVPLLMFGILAMGALSLYISNFGIIFRIRIPIIISFLIVLSLSCGRDKAAAPSFYKRFYRWARIKTCEFIKLMEAIKYFGLSSPLIRFRTFKLLVYGVVYPVSRVILGRKRACVICERFAKKSYLPEVFSCPPLIKSKMVLKEEISWSAVIEQYINNVYEKEGLKEGMNVVDIGAHIGVYTVLAAERVGNRGKVISVEPESGNHKQILENIKINNFNNVIPFKLALSDHNGIEKLYLDSWSTRHSLLVNSESSFVEVETKTLDKLLEDLKMEKIDVIKIDTEGAEVRILKGAEETLKNNPKVKIIVASYHYPSEIEEVRKFLQDKGFKTKVSCFDIVFTI